MTVSVECPDLHGNGERPEIFPEYKISGVCEIRGLYPLRR
jgi:hypothetical protein